jgi:hypothetical protein
MKLDSLFRIFIASVVIAALGACSSDQVDVDAQRLTVAELNTSAGYVWFPAETAVYSPRPEFVADIAKRFTPDTRAIVFVRPTCSCRGTQKLFPHVVKTLMQAGVHEDQIEIFSMRSNQDKHPYADRISVTALPAIFIERSGTVTPRMILDEDFNGSNADSLVAALLR